MQIAWPCSRKSCSAGLERGLRTCVSGQLPVEAGAAGLGVTLGDSLE